MLISIVTSLIFFAPDAVSLPASSIRLIDVRSEAGYRLRALW